MATRRSLRRMHSNASLEAPTKRVKRVSKENIQQPCEVVYTPGPKIVHEYPRLVQGQLLKRYKRFLADIQLGNDEIVTVHCPNTGPMISLLDVPNAGVQLSVSDNAKRKYAHTLEQIQIQNGEWVGVHSTSANNMVGVALRKGWLPQAVEHRKITNIKAEVKHTSHSRIDFVVETKQEDVEKTFYIEVKSVTLATESNQAVFPDTVSTRAQKHVEELIAFQTKAKKDNIQSVILFLVQRKDCTSFAPSRKHDPAFAALCDAASTAGVKLIAFDCELVVEGDKGHVVLKGQLPLESSSENN
ncbi:sugar fermentation stimulation protein [Thraustotheca clavata]|uniref:Sugar fermentation stimulation protein n=1 Tax=Thraustotheca clavata TaxID=74557 RepID=A0A1W0ABH8_9STRA|nr:sugar fermentation stimulation protein [Thraustotheca clavata]